MEIIQQIAVKAVEEIYESVKVTGLSDIGKTIKALICSLFLVGSSCSIWLTSFAIIIPQNALHVLILLTFRRFI